MFNYHGEIISEKINVINSLTYKYDISGILNRNEEYFLKVLTNIFSL